MEKGVILPLFYLPPVEYFAQLLANNGNFELEQYENFPKQTYRNRASICSPNGKLDLIIPVTKGAKVHTPMKDVRISYEFDWQRLHWMSIQTSYRRSAYFEFYEDGLAPFYHKKYEFLFDYNIELLQLFLKNLKVNADLKLTQDYEKNPLDKIDLRKHITPKQDTGYKGKTYYQVFEERNGFLSNLSIADLLFSMGPQSTMYI